MKNNKKTAFDYFLIPFKRYDDFNGRSERAEYWYFFLFNLLITGFFYFIVPYFYWIGVIYSLGTFIPHIAVTIRRLHDINRSGWWFLILFVPLIGVIVFTMFLIKEGDEGKNQYGQSPKQNKSSNNLNDKIKKLSELKDDGVLTEKEFEEKKNQLLDRKENLLSIDDDIVFDKIVEVCNYFGHDYEGYQRAMAGIPGQEDKKLWFPKFYENDEWDNKISSSGKEITEIKKKGNKDRVEEFINNIEYESERVVFAGIKDENSGEIGYKFQGIFKANKEKTKDRGVAVYDRISPEIKILEDK